MYTLRLNVMGHLRLYYGESLCEIESRKGAAVLIYSSFALRPISRTYFCDLLWPNTEDKKARQNLTDAIYSVKQSLRKAQALNQATRH